VDTVANAKTGAEFALGNVIQVPVKESEIEHEGNLHFVQLRYDDKQKYVNTVEIGPSKNWVLDWYNKGSTGFKEELYPIASLTAQIYVFQGDDYCLTDESQKSFNEVKKAVMNRPAKGINTILIRVDKSGEKLLDCIIDGIIIYENETRKV
jgi:hypothetical protein